MTDKKLTDEEIIKAFEECIELRFDDTEYATVKLDTLTNALDLITRQQAENENLKVELQSMRGAANSLKMHYEKAQAEIERLKESLNIELENFATEYDNKIKAEAIKEFAEKLKKRFYLCAGRCVVDVYHIDNLEKEMVGDDNA